MTLQEYVATPESVRPQELICGALHVADAPFVSHQRIVLRLATALAAHADLHGGEAVISPIDVVLDPELPLVLQPDLLYVCPERSTIVGDRIHGAPDLVVEVLSPRPRIGDLAARVSWFAKYGVREIWLYHQFTRRLEVLTCGDGTVASSVSFDARARVRSTVLPAFGGPMQTVVGVL
jgi:Uma2 family endonuclease